MALDFNQIESSDPTDLSDDELLDEITSIVGHLVKPRYFAMIMRRVFVLYARSVVRNASVFQLESQIERLKSDPT